MDVALYANLLSSELKSRMIDGNDMLPEILKKAKQAYELLFEGDTIDEVQVSGAAELIHEIVHSVKEQLSDSRTAHLYFQYLDLLRIWRKNLRTEQKDSFELLSTVFLRYASLLFCFRP